MNKHFSIIGLAMLFPLLAFGQADWKMHSRLSFYTHEDQGEVLLLVPEKETGKRVALTLSASGRLIQQIDTVLPVRVLRMPIALSPIPEGKSDLVLWISSQEHNIELHSIIYRLEDKSNQVKIDRLTGSAIAGNDPFYPFGFYCYSPVQPTLAEEEVVKGFNLISPYQRITDKTLRDREKYMDRCAELGMKVHYNLLSVAGGGGVGSGRAVNQTPAEKRRRLIQEVNRMKDHPALLGWYIADEPTGHRADPDSLKAEYELIKSLDPYHPVTIVFMVPARAREYADAMDVVMADPYPMPSGSVATVGRVTSKLLDEFYAEKPVWIVPQAFGGSEHWQREPTIGEIRSMTWLAVLEGATGIQYFIRHGLNGFPKSTATWGACGKMAVEIQSLSPFLLTGKKMDGFHATNDNVRVAVWERNGELLILAVNEVNEPAPLTLKAPFSLDGSHIRVLFENRTMLPNDATIEDFIDGYGRRIFLVSGYQDDPTNHKGNLILDPGFEDDSSPGVPAACYARVGADRGASYFLDPVRPFEGRYSLRVVTPKEKSGIGLSFFPVRLSPGTGYSLSVWARLDTNSVIPPKRNFFQRLFGWNTYDGSFFRLLTGTYADQSFKLSGEWKKYTLRFTVPDNGNKGIAINPYLELVSQGKAWFDHLELRADPSIDYGFHPVREQFEVTASSTEPDAVIRFTTDGRVPDSLDAELKTPVVLNNSVLFTAGVFVNNRLLNYSRKPFHIHQAVGKQPVYASKYDPKYSGGGAFGLVDGIRGSTDYQDGLWQGFMKKDLDVVIDLQEQTRVREIRVGCLQDTRSWIFMPVKIECWGSVDGTHFDPLGSITNAIDQKTTGAIIKEYQLEIEERLLQAIRVKVTNLGVCPDWHNGKGMAAYLFVDEIVVN